MKKTTFFTIVLFCIWNLNLSAQNTENNFDPSLNEVKTWFKAWDLVYKDVYRLKEIKPVDFVLFDDTYIYTTSKFTGKDAINIVGPSLSNKDLIWMKKEHNGKIMLPDSTETEVHIMSYASEVKNGNAYFVMPLTSYWRKNKVGDHGIGIDTLVNYVFLHEFAHTQQMKSLNDIGKVMEAYEKIHPNDKLSDDILQSYYENDSTYLKNYKVERDLFQQASLTKNKNERIQLAKKALQLLKRRQIKCLEKDGRDIAKMDDVFLTLEGIGEYTAFSWLIHPQGANFSVEKALKAKKTKWWSQEQGFDIILLLSRFMEPKQFSKYMFGQTLTTAIDLLEKQLKSSIKNQ